MRSKIFIPFSGGTRYISIQSWLQIFKQGSTIITFSQGLGTTLQSTNYILGYTSTTIQSMEWTFHYTQLIQTLQTTKHMWKMPCFSYEFHNSGFIGDSQSSTCYPPTCYPPTCSLCPPTSSWCPPIPSFYLPIPSSYPPILEMFSSLPLHFLYLHHPSLTHHPREKTHNHWVSEI